MPKESLSDIREADGKSDKLVVPGRNKRVAISAESGEVDDEEECKNLKRVPKDSATKDFIQKSIKNSSFLKHMDESQMNEMIYL